MGSEQVSIGTESRCEMSEKRDERCSWARGPPRGHE